MHHRHDSRHSGHRGRPEFARSRGPPLRTRTRRPPARRGDVRAAVLALLAERPMHGYEMIKEIEERTQGAWTPERRLDLPDAAAARGGGADPGRGERRQASLHPDRVRHRRAGGQGRRGDPWDAVRAGAAPEAIHLRDSVGKLHHAIGQVFHAADEGQQKRVRELLDESRRKIYAILAEES